MADGSDDFFLFGDDFDAILDVLLEDEEIEEHFTTSVDNCALSG